MKAAAIAAAARIAPASKPAASAAGGDADVDDALAGPIEDRVHEGAELRGLAGRPREGAVEQVEDAADDQREDRPASQACCAAATAATIAIPKPISVRWFGVSPSRPKPTAIGVARPRTRWRSSGVTIEPITTRRSAVHRCWARQAEDRPLARDEGLERLGAEAAHRLAAVSARRDEPGGAQPADVPADERLRQPDLLDQVRHRRVAVREALDDAEPIDVGERLVDDPQLAELVGLVDDRSDGRTDAGGGGGQGADLRGRRTRRINDGLYQRKLMLFLCAAPCQQHV